MRMNELDNLKYRSALIDKQLEDPLKVDRLKELAAVRWIPSLATLAGTEAIAMNRNNNNSSNGSYVRSGSGIRSGSGVRSSSIGMYGVDGTNDNNYDDNNNNDNDKKPRNFLTETSQGDPLLTSSTNVNNEQQQHKQHQHKSFASSEHDDDNDSSYKSVEERILLSSRNNENNISSDALLSSQTSSSPLPKVITKAEKLKKDLFDLQKNDDSDFYLQVVEEGSSMHRSKDYSKVMKIEKIDETAYLTTGMTI